MLPGLEPWRGLAEFDEGNLGGEEGGLKAFGRCLQAHGEEVGFSIFPVLGGLTVKQCLLSRCKE